MFPIGVPVAFSLTKCKPEVMLLLLLVGGVYPQSANDEVTPSTAAKTFEHFDWSCCASTYSTVLFTAF